MKNKFYSLITLSIINITWLSAQPADLAIDGGFEDASAGSNSASGWFFQGPDTVISFLITDSIAHSGTNALMVVEHDRPASLASYAIQAVDEMIMVNENTFYRMSVWAKADSNKTRLVNFTVGMYVTYNEFNRISNQPLTTEWKRYNVVFNTGTHDTVRTPLHFVTNGTYFIDDLSVIESYLASAQTDSTGDSIHVAFGWGITTTSFANNSFIITVNGAGDPPTSISKQGTGIVIALTNKIKPGDVVTISYNSGAGAITYATNPAPPTPDVADFADEPVDNLAVTSTGIKSFANEPVIVTPNPVTNVLQLQQSKASSLTISNLLGQKVMEINHLNGNPIDVSSLDKGVYVLTIINLDGTKSSTKFVKQ